MDAFRENRNIELETQNYDSGVLSMASSSPSLSAASAASAAFMGNTGSLIVVNPDPSISSTSPASSDSSASSIFSIPALVSLPSLFFVKHPQISLEHAMKMFSVLYLSPKECLAASLPLQVIVGGLRLQDVPLSQFI
ncbi:uncharacterized protein N7498_010865 [Penicillium cinerascens]|uniref:Uncharacterized protein n=1 Tax=Penicillium cinerascens TaxID=70096 RepID=A0A9W9JBI2_9EURO|nr:uncharacterized protein N7498_010865 [Penicillium cinerascens]KAJ5191880.1 hypothetical protein N7498_010865 [Penicillium cinerascens]